MVLSVACNLTKTRQIADDATRQFHRQLSEGKDDAIYDAASSEFREATSRESAKRMWAAVRKRMGEIGDFKVMNVFLYTQLTGTIATMQVEASCTKGPLDETFIWSIANGQALLEKYTASSPILNSE